MEVDRVESPEAEEPGDELSDEESFELGRRSTASPLQAIPGGSKSELAVEVKKSAVGEISRSPSVPASNAFQMPAFREDAITDFKTTAKEIARSLLERNMEDVCVRADDVECAARAAQIAANLAVRAAVVVRATAGQSHEMQAWGDLVCLAAQQAAESARRVVSSVDVAQENLQQTLDAEHASSDQEW
eukprot:CAMPEP_0185853078 /NCGR_PEP_ID=MMETSP1354-20130828/17403_1 /TAXON_ID=708628 /ORGANISM="Erythrolobus madagascarensis, Strain CCMP3276" /LENGTH=187 /DNA_ID=CAMNT_0028554485 /DNA_START=188 /DNA_END=748 /DNA_ORIENTATION=+